MKVALIVAAGVGLPIAGTTNAQTLSVCPDNFEALAGTTEPLACTWTVEVVKHAHSRKGQGQPIADNATDQGLALNGRVQVLRAVTGH